MCNCCPKWFNLTVGTTVMCAMGFALGAVINIALEDASTKQKSDWLELIYYPGELWVNVLKMIVVPLIALMMVTLPARVDVTGSVLGQHVLLFHVCTSCFAACEGL
eukprot:UN26785